MALKKVVSCPLGYQNILEKKSSEELFYLREKSGITLVKPQFSFMNLMGRESVNILFDATHLYYL